MLRRLWKTWQSFGRFMGNIVSRLVLTVFYFTIFVPFALGTRLFSDRLGLKAMPERFWQVRQTPVESLLTARKQA